MCFGRKLSSRDHSSCAVVFASNVTTIPVIARVTPCPPLILVEALVMEACIDDAEVEAGVRGVLQGDPELKEGEEDPGEDVTVRCLVAIEIAGREEA